jgi:sulfate adenylyltransferase large subunit
VPAATATRELLRLATAGSVDDGKSTLIGRLLLDTKLLMADQLDAVSRAGVGPDLAAITDGLRAEREQGITIDVAYRFFATPKRSFILADTPGHERYTRNMFTGASTADLAIVLVDARHGVVTQTRRHAQISELLGIRHVVACVNKMDTVDWSRERFEAVAADVRGLAARLEIPDVVAIPISALHGDNVVERSARSPWYDGPALLEHLEEVDVTADRDTDRLRLPVQWVARPVDGHGRAYGGQLAAGTLRAGDEVIALPSGASTEVAAVDALDAEVDAAVPPLSVTVELADDVDVGRGDVLVSPDDPPVAAREIDATVCWMGEEPLRPGRRYALKHTTRSVRATVQAIHERVDAETLETAPEPSELGLNDVGRVTLRTSAVVVADPYAVNRVTGAFILVDEHSNDTVAAGLVLEARPAERAADTAPPDDVASVGARAGAPVGDAAPARRDRVADGAAGVGQVDDRGRARAPPHRGRAGGVPARRRQRPPRALRRPRLRARRPRRAHPARRARRAAHGRRRSRRGRVARLAAARRPRGRAAAARGRRAAVPRGARRHAAGGVRAPRSEGPVRAGAGRRASGLYGRRRAIRGARATRAHAAHNRRQRGRRRRGDRRGAALTRPAAGAIRAPAPAACG